MTQNQTFEICDTPTKTDIQFAKAELHKFISNLLPPENVREINYTLKDTTAEVVGAIIARTTYNTLIVESLWISEQYRGSGLGATLLKTAESKAKEIGCTISATGTFECFGARPFYQKHGYEIVSTSKDSPLGETGYWFNKTL